MKKCIWASLILTTSLFASQVEITADRFNADENKLTTHFIGNVVIIKEKDRLSAGSVFVKFDEDKQPLLYTAVGDVKVRMLMNGKTYDAKGDKLTYEPNTSKYLLLGKAYLHEIDTDKKVYGEKIEINQNIGRYKVDGDGTSPVKFIFQIEDKKK